MIVRTRAVSLRRLVVAAGLIALAACAGEPPGPADLDDFAGRYADAWSSRDPGRLAAFYAEDGSLIVNGTAHDGRVAIRETAAAFMEAFPDMRVEMDSVVDRGDGHAVFYWTWTGTNTGPGGTGRSVNLQGYEEWTFAADDALSVSDGHYDQAQYELQVSGPAE